MAQIWVSMLGRDILGYRRSNSYCGKAERDSKLAWVRDQKHPKNLSLNTSFALAEILGSVTKRKTMRSTWASPFAQTQRTWAELVSERTVKNIWEENHNGSYENAITQAVPTELQGSRQKLEGFSRDHQGDGGGLSSGVLGALEFLAMPKVNILHKRLRRDSESCRDRRPNAEGLCRVSR